MAEKFFDQKPDFKDLVVTVLMKDFIHEKEYKEAYCLAKEELKDKDKNRFSREFIYCGLQRFLNRWSCRRSDEVMENIKVTLDKHFEDIKILRGRNYESITEKEKDKLKLLFSDLVTKHTKGVGLTVASKVLNVLLPDLIVMIDDDIKKEFEKWYKTKSEKQIEDEICFEFQEEMWKWAKDIKKEHWDKLKEVLREAGVEYWNELKLIDAYNWLRITQRINFERIKEIIKNYFCTLE